MPTPKELMQALVCAQAAFIAHRLLERRAEWFRYVGETPLLGEADLARIIGETMVDTTFRDLAIDYMARLGGTALEDTLTTWEHIMARKDVDVQLVTPPTLNA